MTIYSLDILLFLFGTIYIFSACNAGDLGSNPQEDPLEKGIAIHSSILTWRIPWTEEPDGLQSMESQRVGHDQVTNTHTYTYIYQAPRNFIHMMENVFVIISCSL